MSTCWFKNICGKKEDICKNFEDLESCTRYNQMRIQTVKANIPNQFPVNLQLERPKDPTSPDWEVYKNLYKLDIKKFVEDGRQLVIESNIHGNGKTSFAINKLLEYLTTQLGKENSGYFINLVLTLNDIKSAIGDVNIKLPNFEDIFSNVRLLVVDDVGHKKYSEFEENWLLRMLSLRQMKGLATIYTMTSWPKNFDNKEYTLLNLIGDRLYSRIYTGSTHYFLSECDKRSWPKVGF